MFKRRAKLLLTCMAICAIVVGLIAFPVETSTAARDSLALCGRILIPSLFPFFVVSALVIESGIAGYIGRLVERFMRPVFRVCGAGSAALALGLIGGYPIGATCAIDLYEKRLCSKSEAERLLAFCNNSGPAFILGAVGIGIFKNAVLGILLYLIHVVATLIVGVLFRFYQYHEKPNTTPLRSSGAKSFSSAFPKAIRTGLTSTLNVCAFVIFFAVLLRILIVFRIIPILALPFGSYSYLAEKIFIGSIEVTTGLTMLGESGAPLATRFILTAFLLGWAGISIHCQVLSFLGESGLSLKTYIIGKLLHSILSAFLAYFVTKIPSVFPSTLSCMASSQTQPTAISWWISIIFFVFLIILIKKHWKIRRQ